MYQIGGFRKIGLDQVDKRKYIQDEE